ncbi:MAG: hypothetical protein PSX37_05455 [bacterium]|nr:hypothetical protein [bacterium]
MSTRVCYMIRDERGGRLRALRLVGQGVDRTFPADASADGRRNGAGVDIFSAAAWLREELEQARSTRQLTMLVLDDSGSVCSWVTSSSLQPQMVAAAARGDVAAPAEEGDDAPANTGPRDQTPVSYFAADPLEALIQALPPEGATIESSATGEPQRVAVLAAADTPARLLIDALDSLGITVEQVTSFWQAAALAWDPASGPEARRASLIDDSSPVEAGTSTAATIVAEGGRLLWAWSRAGRLVCGGSVRIAPALTPAVEDGELAPLRVATPAGPVADEADVPRLVAEWLSWSLQTGAAPSRITCLLAAENDDAASTDAIARFGQKLGTLWAGATVDIVTAPDPVGSTLRRLSEVLDSTPATRAASAARGQTVAAPSVVGLTSLERRPGRSHRAMFIWASVALIALAACLGVVSWRMSAAASAAKAASEEWRQRWTVVVKESFPDALLPKAGLSVSTQMFDEVHRLEDARKPADRAEPALPVIQELESLSYVLSNPDYSLESVEIDSKTVIKMIVIANDIASAELMLEAINAVAGTSSVDWTATSYRARVDKGENKVTATFTGKWNPALLAVPVRNPQ